MNMIDFLKLASIIVTLPLMGIFIIILMFMFLFSFMIIGPYVFFTKLGVFHESHSSRIP
jgi:hypothetical protein